MACRTSVLIGHKFIRVIRVPRLDRALCQGGRQESRQDDGEDHDEDGISSTWSKPGPVVIRDGSKWNMEAKSDQEGIIMLSQEEILYARQLAETKGIRLPDQITHSIALCRTFVAALTQDIKSPGISRFQKQPSPNDAPPSQKQVSFARSISQTVGVEIPQAAMVSKVAMSNFISQHAEKMKSKPKPVVRFSLLGEKIGEQWQIPFQATDEEAAAAHVMEAAAAAEPRKAVLHADAELKTVQPAAPHENKHAAASSSSKATAHAADLVAPDAQGHTVVVDRKEEIHAAAPTKGAKVALPNGAKVAKTNLKQKSEQKGAELQFAPFEKGGDLSLWAPQLAIKYSALAKLTTESSAEIAQTLFDSLSTLSQECKTPLTNQVVDEDTRGKKLSKKMEPAKQLKKLSNKDLKKMEDEALKPLADISTNASNSFTQWLGARRETIVRH